MASICLVPGEHAQGSMVLQTILFTKPFPKELVIWWLRKHGYRWALEEKPATWRARQVDPACFVRGSLRNVSFGDRGIQGVVGRLKK